MQIMKNKKIERNKVRFKMNKIKKTVRNQKNFKLIIKVMIKMINNRRIKMILKTKVIWVI
jgi:hypothetical protein